MLSVKKLISIVNFLSYISYTSVNQSSLTAKADLPAIILMLRKEVPGHTGRNWGHRSGHLNPLQLAPL